MATRKLTVIVNRTGGAAAAAGEKLKGQLRDAFAKAGAEAEVRLLDGADIAAAVMAAAAAGRLAVGGGDGTVACAAQALKDVDAELAILPLGTLNHLAHDLGIPAELEAAAALAANGTAEPIDVAEVNGHRFVNNASIGLYPFMVRQREAVQDRHGWSKWLATVPAAWAALERLPHHRLRLEVGSNEQRLVTPLLFVGNNRYALEAGEVGKRDSLQDGVLSLFAVAHHRRRALVWFALRTLAGRANREADFVALDECTEFAVHSGGGSIEIALDGEVQRLASPLRFRIEPGALRIVTLAG